MHAELSRGDKQGISLFVITSIPLSPPLVPIVGMDPGHYIAQNPLLAAFCYISQWEASMKRGRWKEETVLLLHFWWLRCRGGCLWAQQMCSSRLIVN